VSVFSFVVPSSVVSVESTDDDSKDEDEVGVGVGLSLLSELVVVEPDAKAAAWKSFHDPSLGGGGALMVNTMPCA